ELIIQAWKIYFEVLKNDLAVGHWTLENADNNDTLMLKLQKLLAECDIQFHHQDHHIHCFPHILNICSGHVSEKMMEISLTKVAEIWVSVLPQDLSNHQTYKEALPIDGFLDRPNNKDMKKHKLSSMEWQVLKVLHQAILALSSERLPMLCKYLVTFKYFYVTWTIVCDDPANPQLHPFATEGLK
ncbi:hypothetical protein PAXRUDRAFT_165752, partial [Paxillus rubicundulus Ve08.2h10]